MTKSKWQIEGMCEYCGNTAGLFKLTEDLWVKTRTGKPEYRKYGIKCVSCGGIFHWYPATGKITRAKSQSPDIRRD